MPVSWWNLPIVIRPKRWKSSFKECLGRAVTRIQVIQFSSHTNIYYTGFCAGCYFCDLSIPLCHLPVCSGGFDLWKLLFFPWGSIFLVPILLTYTQRTSSVSLFIKQGCCAISPKFSSCYPSLINYTWRTLLNPEHPSLCISCSYVHHAVFYLFLLHFVLKDGTRNNAVMSLSDAVIKGRVQLF